MHDLGLGLELRGDQGGEKLFMHWGPVRYATALPKKVEFLRDGRMRLVYWKGTEIARKESLLQSSQRKVVLDGSVLSTNVGAPARDCFFEGTIEGSGTAGLALGNALLISANPKTGRVCSLEPATQKPRAGRTATVPSAGKLRLKLVADGSVVDVYANEVWLFAEHCSRPAADQARLAALDGQTVVSNIRLNRLWTGNSVHHYGFNY